MMCISYTESLINLTTSELVYRNLLCLKQLFANICVGIFYISLNEPMNIINPLSNLVLSPFTLS